MNTIASEWRKARTVRTFLWLGVGAVAVVATGAIMTTSSTPAQDMVGPVHDQPFFLLASVNLSLFALLIGVRSSTDEFRYGTVEWAALYLSERWKLVLGKAVVAAVVGGAISLSAGVTGGATALAVSSTQGGNLDVTTPDVGAMAGLVVAAAGWSVIGVAVGMVVRHQVAAAVGAAVWVLAVENLGASFLGDAGRFLPGQAAHALAGVDVSTSLLSRPSAAALLVGFVGITLTVASLHFHRRPVVT